MKFIILLATIMICSSCAERPVYTIPKYGKPGKKRGAINVDYLPNNFSKSPLYKINTK